MADREPFLSRWSRRKSGVREGRPPGQQERKSASPAPEEQAEDAVDLTALPDIDELDVSSDFADFMKPGVPHELRTRALRKLWTLDPMFSRVDRMEEYGRDYTAALQVRTVVRTAWEIGKGMPGPEVEGVEETEDVAEVPDPADPQEGGGQGRGDTG